MKRRGEVILRGAYDHDKKNVALFIGKLAGGGAERMVSRLSVALSDQYNIYIILYSPDRIQYRSGGTVINAGGRSGNLRLRIFHSAVHFNRIMKKYKIDLVISFLEAPNIINGLLNHSCNKVVSLRTWQEKAMIRSLSDKMRYGLIRRAARKSDMLTTLTERQRQVVICEMSISPEKTAVIKNFYDTDLIREKALRPVEDERIREFLSSQTAITVSRLVDKKNISRLLRVFRLVLEEFPDARLLILGDGPLKTDLQKLCDDLEISGSVMFAGEIKEPYPVIGKAGLYISLSENEGFPNALTEAMACSLPVMHTDCPTGPREILDPIDEDGTGEVCARQPADHVEWTACGVLLPVEGKGEEELHRRREIAEAWICMLTTKELRDRYAQAGAERASDYDVHIGRRSYIQLIEKVLKTT